MEKNNPHYYNGKVLFKQGKSKRNQSFIDNLNSKNQRVWNVNNENVSFSLISKFTLATSAKDIEETDHVIYTSNFLPRPKGMSEEALG